METQGYSQEIPQENSTQSKETGTGKANEIIYNFGQ